MRVTSKCVEGNHVSLLVAALRLHGDCFILVKHRGMLKHCSMPLVIKFLYVCVCVLFLFLLFVIGVECKVTVSDPHEC